ncbi:MAG TPA: hypothetical protein VGR87_06015 [Candidatus Limnocylindria bacterium]|jgi:hypothetical protein|nr:hypothetical protein [Candidatus Limnocylindria bacterium]
MARKASTHAHSRRTVLKAAAAGTAAFGLVVAGRGVVTDTAASAGALDEGAAPVVAYVSDARKGELVVMVGTREIVRRDAGLVARLLAIAKEARDVVAS